MRIKIPVRQGKAKIGSPYGWPTTDINANVKHRNGRFGRVVDLRKGKKRPVNKPFWEK